MEVDMLDRRMIFVSHYLFNVSFFENWLANGL